MLNYDYYKNNFLGDIIPSEILFNKFKKQAENYVLSHINKPVLTEQLYDVICAIAEVDYNDSITEDNLVSESIGGWSRTYSSGNNSKKDIRSRKQALLYDYLANTGLLYCGL